MMTPATDTQVKADRNVEATVNRLRRQVDGLQAFLRENFDDEDVVQCGKCGHVLREPDVPRICLREARINADPDDCYPAECAAQCPECGTKDNFVEI